MIDERTDELAALYALDLLEGEELRAIEQRLAYDSELRLAVDRFRQSASLLAHTVAPRELSPDVERRLLEQIRRPEPKVVAFPGLPRWIPWTLAAALAIACGVLFQSNRDLQSAARRLVDETHSLGASVAGVEAARRDLAARLDQSQDRVGELTEALARSEERGRAMELQIATLKSKLPGAPNASAVVVWDSAKQRGLIQLANVPPPPPGRDYQLWVIDPQYQAPVSAGVIGDSAAPANASFHPDQLVAGGGKFAISLEKKGGSPTPQGPIVFLSN